MKHPGLQHKARLEEALTVFIAAKGAFTEADAKYDKADRDRGNAFNERRSRALELSEARHSLERLMDAEKFGDDGLPTPAVIA